MYRRRPVTASVGRYQSDVFITNVSSASIGDRLVFLIRVSHHGHSSARLYLFVSSILGQISPKCPSETDMKRELLSSDRSM